VTINAPLDPLQIADATITDASAYLASDGGIILEVTGGLQPYTFDWTRDSDGSNIGGQDVIDNLTADSYTVTIIDTNGCSVIETYVVDQPDIVEETIVQPICSGDANGSIALLVNRGNGSFTYLWSTGTCSGKL